MLLGRLILPFTASMYHWIKYVASSCQDVVVTSHVLSCTQGTVEKDFQVQIKNPGISDVAVRCDQKVFATGGWDGR